MRRIIDDALYYVLKLLKLVKFEEKIMALVGDRYRRVDLGQSGSIHVSNKKILDSFKEDISYSPKIPYSIILQRLNTHTIIPLHFADTLEIPMINNLSGSATVAGKKIILDGSPVVITILPNMLHSFDLKPVGEGTILNLKISLENMRAFMDLEGILSANGHTLNALFVSRQDYYALLDAVMHMAKADSYFFSRMRWMLKVYELLDQGISSNPPELDVVIPDQERLNNLLLWTEKHCCKRILIDDAAEIVRLSKYYFCRYFKQETGISYLTFLHQVRIRHAIKLLISGKNMKECCYECGYENLPYFIQLFRKITGYSSRDFLRHYYNEDHSPQPVSETSFHLLQ